MKLTRRSIPSLLVAAMAPPVMAASSAAPAPRLIPEELLFTILASYWGAVRLSIDGVTYESPWFSKPGHDQEHDGYTVQKDLPRGGTIEWFIPLWRD